MMRTSRMRIFPVPNSGKPVSYRKTCEHVVRRSRPHYCSPRSGGKPHRRKLRQANLTNTNFITADLSNTDFSGRNYADSPPTLNNTVFDRSDLRGADFSHADLTSAKFEESFCYVEATTWPKGFAPPIKEDEICSLFD
jgi:hypothetical protein